jgi:hypothetical protein
VGPLGRIIAGSGGGGSDLGMAAGTGSDGFKGTLGGSAAIARLADIASDTAKQARRSELLVKAFPSRISDKDDLSHL